MDRQRCYAWMSTTQCANGVFLVVACYLCVVLFTTRIDRDFVCNLILIFVFRKHSDTDGVMMTSTINKTVLSYQVRANQREPHVKRMWVLVASTTSYYSTNPCSSRTIGPNAEGGRISLTNTVHSCSSSVGFCGEGPILYCFHDTKTHER